MTLHNTHHMDKNWGRIRTATGRQAWAVGAGVLVALA